jgi:hypothetical protein
MTAAPDTAHTAAAAGTPWYAAAASSRNNSDSSSISRLPGLDSSNGLASQQATAADKQSITTISASSASTRGGVSVTTHSSSQVDVTSSQRLSEVLLSHGQVGQLQQYLDHLLQVNQVMNLTGELS